MSLSRHHLVETLLARSLVPRRWLPGSGKRRSKLRLYRFFEDRPSWIRRSERLQEVGMCPACIASAGVVVGSAVSTGGLTALVVKVLRKKKGEKSELKGKE